MLELGELTLKGFKENYKMWLEEKQVVYKE